MKRIAFVTASVGMLLAAAVILQAQADSNSNSNRLTVPFGDPSRPAR